MHATSLCCAFDTGTRIACRNLAVTLFQVYRKHVRPLSELLLEQSGTIDPESSLGAIERMYARQGWNAPERRPQLRQCAHEYRPSLVAPHLPYSTHYEMMGVSVTALEALVSEFVPHFSLQSIQVTLCEEIDSTPPELAFPVAMDSGISVVDDKRDNENDGGGDSQYIHIVPVFTLPLILSMLPDCYQRATNTLMECERLRGALLYEASHIQLRRQLQLMDANRHYLAFVQQQALHFHQTPLARRDAERELFEQDLRALVKRQLEATEAAEARQRKLRRKLKRL